MEGHNDRNSSGRYLLTSGSLTESELEEIKREAAQDGKPVSGLLSVTTDVCPGVDVVSALSYLYSSVVTPLLDNVSPCMASVRCTWWETCRVNDARGS